ncbi:hypothetical protein TruAng_006449 [Truncatella angustata]|nr:hypothetical protein TruAng_006449 [Truncatella angustata]
MARVIGTDVPKYGRRVLLKIIDDKAADEPDAEWISTPRSSDPKDGWEKVTYRQLANAITFAAHKILAEAGQPSQTKFPTIAYIGPSDCRYLIFAFAAIRVGYKSLFISPRNSLEGQIRLFENTDCEYIAHTPEFSDHVDLWLQRRKMKSYVVSPVQEWYADLGLPLIPYERDFEQAQWEPLAVLHTSGSTGFPKPIVVKQGSLAIADAQRLLPKRHGGHPWLAEMEKTGRIFLPMPFFHMAGLFLATIYVSLDTPASIGIASRPLTADLAFKSIKHSGAESTMLPPSVLEEMSQESSHVDCLSKLKMVMFGGGNLSHGAGSKLVDHGTKLGNFISSTEFAPYPIYSQPDPKLWQYFHFASEMGGFDWRKQPGDDNIYQLFVKRKDRHPGLQGVFYTFPELDEWDTKDLYRPHPTLEDRWSYYGRADDVIVFSNGEKLNPVSLETIVTSHPQIKGVLVVGANRFEPAMILEPFKHPETEQEARDLIESVWPLVKEANGDTVAHGQIDQNLITLSNPEKPFLRAGKGTIQRALTVQSYQEEIDQIYGKSEQNQHNSAPPLDIASEERLMESLQQLFTDRFGTPKLAPETDFFSAGIDSLQVMNACRLISVGLKASGAELSSLLVPREIYSHPTFRSLAAHLYKLSKNRGLQGDFEDEEMSEMKIQLERYTKDLPVSDLTKPAPNDQDQTIILTGSTGALGSYILVSLCQNSNVKKIICLNRSEDGCKRQTQVCVSRGLSKDFDKCEFLQADMSKPYLGLTVEDYDSILSTADRVIHNQWPVNFNMSTASFEPHVRGVRHLVDFSTQAVKRVPIVFISSIGTLERWGKESAVPEERIPDLNLSMGGYGRSKQVASLILDEAATTSGIPVAIIRVGQIAGPRQEKGAWNRQEWLPSLIASSLYLGMLPATLANMNAIDWVPIEDVAHIILEITGVGSRVPIEDLSGYFHCVNPDVTTWETLVPAIKEFYGERLEKIVSFDVWLNALQKSQGAIEDPNENPAIKLLDMYQGLQQASMAGMPQMRFAMDRTKAYSKVATDLRAVTPDLMTLWCKQWGF